jgi:hypothetical protein
LSPKRGNNRVTFAVVLTLALALALALAGCGESGGPAAGEIQVSVSTEPDPPRSGPVDLTVEVKDSQGKAVDGARVIVNADMVGMNHAGLEGEMAPHGAGKYKASGEFIMSGTWRIKVDVTKDGLPAKSQTFHLDVR